MKNVPLTYVFTSSQVALGLGSGAKNYNDHFVNRWHKMISMGKFLKIWPLHTCKSAVDNVNPSKCPPISDSICEFHMILMRSSASIVVRSSAFKRLHVPRQKGLAFKSFAASGPPSLQNCWRTIEWKNAWCYKWTHRGIAF